MTFLDKLAKIEALIQRASSEGERQAAQFAKERVLSKLNAAELADPNHPRPAQTHPALEYKISLGSLWEKKLFIALCNKHGYKTYRYQRQKHTTACLKISKHFMETTLWPEYQSYATMLRELVDDILQDLINKIHKVEEEEIVFSGEIGSSSLNQ